MIIGVPTEIKTDEYRVAMLPVGVEELVARGHQLLVQAGAGLGSGLPDALYLRAGAETVASGAEIFERADLVIKVKEPQSEEYPLIRAGQLLFTYFHFAASRALTEAMLSSGATCLAYETLRDQRGRLPLLTPMSEVAGRMSIQAGRKISRRRRWAAVFCWAAFRALPRAHHRSRWRNCRRECGSHCGWFSSRCRHP